MRRSKLSRKSGERLKRLNNGAQQPPASPQKQQEKTKRRAKESLTNPSEKSGLPPSSLVHVGDVCQLETIIQSLTYNMERVEQQRISTPEQLAGFDETDSVAWITVEGLTDVSLIEAIGTMAG